MKRCLFCGAVALCLVVLLVSPALASNVRMDYKTGQPQYFQMFGGEFHRVETGGYNNPSSNLPCWPSHIWSYVALDAVDCQCIWMHPSVQYTNFTSWTAYITTSGTSTRAEYSCASGTTTFNQYTHHGWSSIWGAGTVYDGFWLSDKHVPADYSASQKVDWDAIQVYY